MELHGKIMNLPDGCGLSEIGTTYSEQLAYKRGHKAARHAAAELASEAAAELESLRRDAERYRWLATEHAVMLLKRFPSPGPYHKATEVIDAAIDAAMTGETR